MEEKHFNTILCMYSGGLDSAGALYRLLAADEYSEFRIHVHHMHLVNRENRWKAEKLATERTLKTFIDSGYRKFRYTSSTHQYRSLRKRFIWDMDLCAFMSANLALNDRSIRHVAMGRTKTDVEEGGFNFNQRMERAQRIFKGVLSLDEIEIGYIFPVIDFSKQELWEMLPEWVRRHVWSCRRPLYNSQGEPKACGRCITCKDMAKHTPELFAQHKNYGGSSPLPSFTR